MQRQPEPEPERDLVHLPPASTTFESNPLIPLKYLVGAQKNGELGNLYFLTGPVYLSFGQTSFELKASKKTLKAFENKFPMADVSKVDVPLTLNPNLGMSENVLPDQVVTPFSDDPLHHPISEPDVSELDKSTNNEKENDNSSLIEAAELIGGGQDARELLAEYFRLKERYSYLFDVQ